MWPFVAPVIYSLYVSALVGSDPCSAVTGLGNFPDLYALDFSTEKPWPVVVVSKAGLRGEDRAREVP